MRLCTIAGCGRPYLARGYCRAHYERVCRLGDPLASKPIFGPTPPYCDCPISTPERIPLFDAWQCSVCYRKCDAPVVTS